LLVLDELIAAYNHGLVDREQVLAFLKEKPEDLEVVMTGRDPAPELLELADYVSEIQKRKHPFDRGMAARKGIEM
ncbi:cob(I)yrinic acid a,c-diamide adenosyltransferase, partial [Xanthomonas citri pv. citri]|nr:cob(I)yrinic acid a,c-diamide adenosyltransferase [Xanthomonas citri pv. citri]